MLNRSKIWEGGGIIDFSADKPVGERKIILWNLEQPTTSFQMLNLKKPVKIE